MLTDLERFGGRAEEAFDVVVPSIPGFGFSGRRAMTSGAVADLRAQLTTELSYGRFAAGATSAAASRWRSRAGTRAG